MDPLDGTVNFAHGYPFFSTSVAAAVDGHVVAGAVYDPIGGALHRGAGRAAPGPERTTAARLAASTLVQSLLVTGFPYDIHDDVEGKVRLFRRFMGVAQAIRRDGSAALDLCYLAAGRIDGFCEERLNAWDMAAGNLLVEEAGGRVSRYDGSPWPCATTRSGQQRHAARSDAGRDPCGPRTLAAVAAPDTLPEALA